MIGALLLACLAGDPVSVRVESDRKECYLGESIPVRIRIEVDESSLVPLTLRRTDVPVLLEAPWLKGLAAGEGDATLAVNDDVVPARRTEAGGSTVLVLERAIRPEKAGDLELAAPVVRFASATRFDTDALGTRIALDRTEGSAKGNALAIRVLPLPAEGRPEGFSGGVGRFTITASADATEVPAGQSLRLILSVTGEGNLSAVAPPRLDGLAGFHVVGRLDGGDAAKRTFTYEIEPTGADVKEIPSIVLAYFDPTPPAGYREARTPPLPLRVLPRHPPATTLPSKDDGGGTSQYFFFACVAIVVIVGLRRWRKARQGSQG